LIMEISSIFFLLISPLCKRGARGDFKRSSWHMLKYNRNLKQFTRNLRNEMTDYERILWSRLRGKQINNIQFYRQKPIGNYIVDFYAPKAKLVIEIDGSQHVESEHKQRDEQRDNFLMTQGLTVLRFNNIQVAKEIEAVMEIIFRHCCFKKHI